MAILLDILKHSKEHKENSKIKQLSCSHPGQPKLVLEVLVYHPFDTTEPVVVLSETALRMCLKEVHDITRTHTLERFTTELVEVLSKDLENLERTAQARKPGPPAPSSEVQ
jgi:broad-specificity NMP kinase